MYGVNYDKLTLKNIKGISYNKKARSCEKVGVHAV